MRLARSARKIRAVAAVFAAAAFFVLCGGSLTAFGQTVVRVATETTIEGDQVQLGAIAAIEGEPGIAERLARISLGYAPNVGMTREIGSGQIMLAIRTAGLSEKEVRIESPTAVLVRRPGQILSEALVREAIEHEFLSRLRSENVSARLTRLRLPPNIQVPAGAIELRVNSSSVRNIFMPFSIPVEIRVNGSLVRTFPAICEIEAFTEVLRAASDLPAGTRITEREVRKDNVRLDRPVDSYIRDISVLRGVALTRGLRNGSVLTRDSLASVTVIKQGDPVRIEAGSGKMKIIVNGEAKAAGRIGDRIAVRNSQTGTILQAYVVEKGIVRVTL